VWTIVQTHPASFDRHAGACRFAPGAVVTFWRDAGRFRSRSWHQAAFDMFAASQTAYFARWFFPESGASTVTLCQNAGPN
jgi:hypothetical protein